MEGSVSLLKIEKLDKALRRNQPEKEDIEVSYDLLLNYLFPDLENKFSKEICKRYEKGYREAIKRQTINFSPSKMQGNIDVIKGILDILKRIEVDIDFMNYDAASYGWKGAPFMNEENIRKAFEKWHKEGICLCEKALNLKGEIE